MATSKPLNMKAYGKIPHLQGSRLGPGDHHVNHGQNAMCLTKAVEKVDVVIVQEKYDGSCTAVAKHEGQIIPLNRSGYVASTSPYDNIRMFGDWVYRRSEIFDRLLEEGERAVGEWLGQAIGTLYKINRATEAWVLFDIMDGHDRISQQRINKRMADRHAHFCRPEVIHIGSPLSLHDTVPRLTTSPYIGQHVPIAFGPPEGMVYRVERESASEPLARGATTVLIAKWVRHDKLDGYLIPSLSGLDPVWNWRPDGQTWRTKGLSNGRVMT